MQIEKSYVEMFVGPRWFMFTWKACAHDGTYQYDWYRLSDGTLIVQLRQFALIVTRNPHRDRRAK